MKIKYILLDEILLEVITDTRGEKMIFESKEEAVKYGEDKQQSWQVIEIPFGN